MAEYETRQQGEMFYNNNISSVWFLIEQITNIQFTLYILFVYF